MTTEKDRRVSEFPEGWDPARVQRLIDYYENQPEEEALAEDEAARADYLCSEKPNE